MLQPGAYGVFHGELIRCGHTAILSQVAAQATEALLASGRTPDAILAGSDQIARGALDALREAGLRVPHDVAVMGFDNWNILTEGARPPLTSVDMQLQAIGREAAIALSRAIAGEPIAGVTRMSVRVVPRESTASVAHRD